MKNERCKAHLYIRTKTDKGTFNFKCTRCPHYAPAKLVLGRMAKCHYCTNEFIMHKESIKLVKPHCGCRNTVKIGKVVRNVSKIRKKPVEQVEIDEATSEFLDELVRKL